MPIEVLTRGHEPAPLARCPKCGAEPFEPFMRFMVARDMYSLWRAVLALFGRTRPAFAVICRECKEIVGYE